MRNLMMKFARFMSDRYARVDSITLTCIVLSLVVDIITGFFSTALRLTGAFVSSALTIYALYRPFSKNIWKREAENRKFSAILKKIKQWWILNYRRVRYVKSAVFVRCPRCRAVIRFPRKKGDHMARCPACSEKFRVKVRF